MEYSVNAKSLKHQQNDCLVIGVQTEKKLTGFAAELDAIGGGYLQKLIKNQLFIPNNKPILFLPEFPGLSSSILLVGLGDPASFKESDYRKTWSELGRTIKNLSIKSISCAIPLSAAPERDIDWHLVQQVLLLEQAFYQFSACKSKTPDAILLKKVSFIITNEKKLGTASLAIQEAAAVAAGISLTKDLGNLPANICTPTYLAKQALKLTKSHKKIKTTIVEEAEMEKLGMGAFLSVSHGSREPAKLIIMQYQGSAKSQKPLVLVGKGITFDSGGISLKPGAAMDEMKFDMCGAATVMGVMQACASLQLPINLICAIAASENLPGGSATKPGDIVTTMSGQTVEILNTDAEGRLVLCDTLTYISRYNPELVIDIATLTGAMVIALGDQASGVMTNHEPLARELMRAGNEIGDRLWEFPLWDEYQESLDSNFADIANVSGGRGAGSITAGCFLSRFTKDYHWAHLDIAGTAWLSGKMKGATGRPVPALMQFILNRCH